MSAASVQTYHTDHGRVVAVVGRPGRKLLPVVYIDSPIRLRKVAITEGRYMRELADYPPRKAARRMLDAGKRLGISKAARRFLREVVAS